jgi:hypothetical protein
MESALPDIQRGDELSYVTRHFADLQGLRSAPFWASLVLLDTLGYAHQVSRHYDLELVFGMLALSGVWWACAGHWYRRHYGLVTPKEERVPSQILSILQTERRQTGAAWWWFVAWAFVGVLWILHFSLHRPDGPSSGSAVVMVTFTMTLLQKARYPGPASPWIRGRQLMAIGGSATIAVLYLCSILGRLDSWLFMDGAAAVLLLAGLYDHQLLTRLLNGSFRENRNA